jgi:predicted ATPase
MRSDLPTGIVTLLFTDIEGSTKLLHDLGPEKYAHALAEHRRILRAAFDAHGGVEVDTQGDAFFVAFGTAPSAVKAAAEALHGLEPGPIRVRMGLHSGTPYVTAEGYVGADVHRAARIAACGHGGQVLISSATASLVERPDLHDLGEHRLKDLSAPEQIYQLGGEEFPPLNTLHQTNLPIPATPFLGRERELAEVTGLLSQDDVRLLTLTGPGGTGKTRLAAQAAAALSEHYPNGTWWLPLAPLREPELVLATAAQVLGSKNGLAEHIADKSMLLLFDNFEQVVDAAPDVAALLDDCPNLDLLVTSRERLNVTAEQEYPVPPLVHAEGIGFFTTRARAVKLDYEPDDAVSEICRRLDDLPLALELAAARVKVLSSRQILNRLESRLPLLTGGARDLPDRQRTLRATIEWSYELLEDDERRLFRRLGIFSGGCTLEAAEQVADAHLDTIQSLVDKSLVRCTADRYWMLETIREYSGDRLEETGEAAELARRHAAHFLALAEEGDLNLRGKPADWLERLELDHDNFRSALDWLESVRETQLALELAGALGRFWYQRGHQAEGARRLERVLAGDDRATPERASALNAASTLALVTGDAATAKAHGEEALTLHRQFGDGWGEAHSLFVLAHVAAEQRDFERGRQLFEECLERFLELGDDHYILLAKFNLAWMCGELGDRERDQALLAETLSGARATSNEQMAAQALHGLAFHANEDGRFEEALEFLKESYAIHCDLGELPQIPDVLNRLASVLATAGKVEAATQLLAKGAALNEELGAGRRAYVAERNQVTLEKIRDRIDEAAYAAAWEAGRVLRPDEAVALAVAEFEVV